MKKPLLILTLMLITASPTCFAEIRTSSVFGDSMVLQRSKPIHIWGWADPGSSVEVSLAGKSETVKSDADGRFDAKLPAMKAGGPHQMKISSGDQTLQYNDVLIGEVWVCSGQSNMQWAVEQADDADLESLAANFPSIRLISVPRIGTQEPQSSFDGKWESCTPETVKQFSAVGFYFGRQLHQTLGVPIGLIDTPGEGHLPKRGCVVTCCNHPGILTSYWQSGEIPNRRTTMKTPWRSSKRSLLSGTRQAKVANHQRREIH